MARPEGLWSTGDIARHLGVDPSTVSNYRKRFDDFPASQVVEGSSRAYYDRGEVLAWLARNPQLGTPEAAKKSEDRTVVRVAEELRMFMNADAVADGIGTMLVAIEYKQRQGRRGDVRSINDVRSDLDSASTLLGDREGMYLAAHLPEQVLQRAYEMLSDVPDRPAAYDHLLFSNVGSVSYEHRTARSLARFLSALAPGPSRSVYDPAAGTGELLRAVATAHAAIEGRGVDISEQAVETANRRFFLSGDGLHVERGDSLQVMDDGLFEDGPAPFLADLVVVDPPFSSSMHRLAPPSGRSWTFGTPSTSSSDLAWLDIAVRHLTSEGRAIVVTPATALSRTDSSTDGIRRELIRRGALEAVIALPSGVREGSTVRTAVWVLRKPDRSDRRDRVLLVNAPTNRSEALSTSGLTATTVRSWLQDEGYELDPKLAVAVPVIDLLAPGATLLPNRWTDTTVEAVSPIVWAKRVSDAYEHTVRVVSNLGALPLVQFEPDDRSYPRVTVRQLLSESAESIRGRYIERSTADGPDTLKMLSVGVARAGGMAAQDAVERVADTPATRSQEVRPGDVLVYPDGDGVGATVWREPGWVLGRFMQVIRLHDETWNREYVAASLASAANARFLVGGTARTHFRIEEFELVARPRGDQDRLALLAGSLSALTTQLVQAQEQAQEAHRLLLDAYSAGVVDARLMNKLNPTNESQGDAHAL